MDIEHQSHDRSRAQSFVLYALGLTWLVIVVVKFLSLGLFLDETVSYWVTKDGPTQAISRELNIQGQSPVYYLLLGMAQGVLGSSEMALRIPSLIAWLLCGYVLVHIGQRMTNSWAALFGLILFASADPVIKTLSARPYAFALLFTLLAILSLLRWLESNRTLFGSFYIISATLSFYFHYLFAVAFVIHGALLWLSRNRKLTIGRYIIALVLIVLLCLPGFFQLANLVSRQTQLSFAGVPGFMDWLKAIFPPVLAVYFAFSLVLLMVIGARLMVSDRPKLADPNLLVLLLWTVIGPTFFYIYSVFFVSLFVDRYFVWSLAGLSLLLGAALAHLVSNKYQKLLAIVLLATSCVRELDRRWVEDGWREVSQELAHQTELKVDNVFLYSGLIESHHPSFFQSQEHLDYLAAPVSYYLIPVPLRPINQSWQSIVNGGKLPSTLKESVERNGSIYLISYRTSPRSKQRDNVSQIDGYQVRPIGQYGQVDLISITQLRQ